MTYQHHQEETVRLAAVMPDQHYFTDLVDSIRAELAMDLQGQYVNLEARCFSSLKEAERSLHALPSHFLLLGYEQEQRIGQELQNGLDLAARLPPKTLEAVLKSYLVYTQPISDKEAARNSRYLAACSIAEQLATSTEAYLTLAEDICTYTRSGKEAFRKPPQKTKKVLVCSNGNTSEYQKALQNESSIVYSFFRPQNFPSVEMFDASKAAFRTALQQQPDVLLVDVHCLDLVTGYYLQDPKIPEAYQGLIIPVDGEQLQNQQYLQKLKQSAKRARFHLISGSFKEQLNIPLTL